MNELALFAGAGGGVLAGHLLGWTTVCAVECDAYAAQVLAARQNDKSIRPFPIWSDIKSFDGKIWNGIVDVVSGGFPCQDISVAGSGAGIGGEKSGLWKHMARVVYEVQPRFVFVENSPLLIKRGLAVVLGDLAEMGYDAEWCIISASDCGAPHKRDRLWIVANSMRARKGRDAQAGISSDFNKGAERLQKGKIGRSLADYPQPWGSEPAVGRVADGVAHRLDILKALGNGQVPRVAATAFSLLKG